MTHNDTSNALYKLRREFTTAIEAALRLLDDLDGIREPDSVHLSTMGPALAWNHRGTALALYIGGKGLVKCWEGRQPINDWVSLQEAVAWLRGKLEGVPT